MQALAFFITASLEVNSTAAYLLAGFLLATIIPLAAWIAINREKIKSRLTRSYRYLEPKDYDGTAQCPYCQHSEYVDLGELRSFDKAALGFVLALVLPFLDKIAKNLNVDHWRCLDCGKKAHKSVWHGKVQKWRQVGAMLAGVFSFLIIAGICILFYYHFFRKA